jgi:hypothetical protein
MAAFFLKSLPVAGGARQHAGIFGQRHSPRCNAHDLVAGRRQWDVVKPSRRWGSSLSTSRATVTCKNGFQKINVFADKRFWHPWLIFVIAKMFISAFAAIECARLAPRRWRGK